MGRSLEQLTFNEHVSSRLDSTSVREAASTTTNDDDDVHIRFRSLGGDEIYLFTSINIAVAFISCSCYFSSLTAHNLLHRHHHHHQEHEQRGHHF